MEVVRNVVAARAGWRVLHLAERISGAGRHGTALVGCQVPDGGDQALAAVVEVDYEPVAGVHEQSFGWIGRSGLDEVKLDRVGRSLRSTVQGEVRKIYVLETTQDCVRARGIEGGPVDRVLGQTVDCHRDAPAGRITAEARELLDVPGRIELQLHEGRAWMIRTYARIDDVAIAVRRTRADL